MEQRKRWTNVGFAVLFVLSLGLFGTILLPFVMPLLLGGFLVVLFQPAQDFLARRLPRHRPLAAGLSTAAVLLLIVVPLSVTAFFVGRELLAVVDGGRALLERPGLQAEVAARLPRVLRPWVQGDGSHLDRILSAGLSQGADLLKELLGAGTQAALNTFLMTVSMYYFFLDGRRLFRETARLIPMEPRYLDAFAQEFKDVAYAIVYGNTLTAAAQGLVGLVGLLLAGVAHPLVWAAGMAVVALVPLGGTALVWLPLSLGLMATGRPVAGMFLLAWGALVVSTVDNLIRPRLCGSRMTMHPLLVFLSMFGGLAVFGVMGLLIGPLIAALFMAMVRIYRRDFLVPATGAVETRLQAHRRRTEAPSGEATVQH